MMKVVACFSASGMLIYKGCGYSSYKPRNSHCLDRTSDLGRGGMGRVGGGGGMCDIGDCDIRAKQNTSQKTIPTAEDTFITENINPYFSVLHELTVIWRPLA